MIAKSQPKFFCFLHIWCVIQKSSVFTVYTHSLHVRVPRASQGSTIELERVNEMKTKDALTYCWKPKWRDFGSKGQFHSDFNRFLLEHGFPIYFIGHLWLKANVITIITIEWRVFILLKYRFHCF